MYHFIYKVTNLVNGKWYIGKHSSRNLDDGYLGSGIAIRKAVEKFGKENFSREILEFCKSSAEAYSKEAELVTMEVVNDPMSYNLCLGGKVCDYETIAKIADDKAANIKFDDVKHVGTFEDIRKIYGRKWKIMLKNLYNLAMYCKQYIDCEQVITKAVALSQTNKDLIALFSSSSNVCKVMDKAIEVGMIKTVIYGYVPGVYSRYYACNNKMLSEVIFLYNTYVAKNTTKKQNISNRIT